MTYQETVDYLFSRLPLFSKVGSAAYKADITNTVKLCSFLGDPQNKFRSIHIAGTNGKGSTSHMLAAILQSAGYKTGLYTSPHLKDFRERIRINGEMISENFVIDFVERTKLISAEVEPSFFELGVAMAFDYFAAEKVDFAVVETGLGGRLDSTNILSPILSIITNIGYDHQNILGDTLELIAAEKAGIIKNNTPVIIGETSDATKSIFINKSLEMNAPITFADHHFTTLELNYSPFSLHIRIKNNHTDTEQELDLDLNGIYQQKNLAAVLAAVEKLNKLHCNISPDEIKTALNKVKKLTGLHGRWDVIATGPFVILDIAHNQDGIRQVLHQLSIMKYEKLHLILGMVKDKDHNSVLILLPQDAKYYFTNAHIPRALNAEELKAKAAAFNLAGECYDDVNIALSSALNNAGQNDLILICGSVFVVGEVDVNII